MMEHILMDENFALKITPKVFEADIIYPSNTIMEVEIKSNSYSVRTTMDVDAKKLAEFADSLCEIYESLIGEARIEEPYGKQMFISFTGDGKGHIGIEGYLADDCFSLEFSDSTNQTYLKEFCYGLKKTYSKYRK